MARRHMLVTTCLLIAATLSACSDLFTGEGEAEVVPQEPNPRPGCRPVDYCLGPFPGPVPRPPNLGLAAISVMVQPNLEWPPGHPRILHPGAVGTIRDGSYVDSLRVFYRESERQPYTFAWAGHVDASPWARPGTYDVTVAEPGHITWDTTGVVVKPNSYGNVTTVYLSVQLVETP